MSSYGSRSWGLRERKDGICRFELRGQSRCHLSCFSLVLQVLLKEPFFAYISFHPLLHEFLLCGDIMDLLCKEMSAALLEKHMRPFLPRRFFLQLNAYFCCACYVYVGAHCACEELQQILQ